MHGGTSPGAPSGEKNGMYRTGKYTKTTRALGRLMRKLAKQGEALVARTMHEAGLRPLKAIRRKAHVRRALAKLKGKQSNAGQSEQGGQGAPATQKAEG
jgi:hypothetical protein